MKQVGLNERIQEIEGWVTYCAADPDKKQVLQDYQNTYRELVSVLKALEIVQNRLQYVEQEAKASSLSAKTWAALRKELDEIKIKLDERAKQAKKIGIMMDEIDALFSRATIELTKAESKLIAPEESKQNP
jgi:protein tyrosine/serine phosphatase